MRSAGHGEQVAGFCPNDPELEATLNRSLTSLGEDNQRCQRMLECLYGTPLEPRSAPTPYDECLRRDQRER